MQLEFKQIEDQAHRKHLSEFWGTILIDNKGNLSLEDLCKELSNYYDMIDRIRLITCHVTRGMLSKSNYPAETVNNMADEMYMSNHKEYVEEFLTEFFASGEPLTLEEAKKQLNDYWK